MGATSVQGNRKLIAAGAVIALASAAVIVKGDVPSGFVTILEYVFAAFVAGNSVEHITSALKARAVDDSNVDKIDTNVDNTDTTAVVQQLAAIDQKMDNLASMEAEAKQSISIISNTLAAIIKRLWPNEAPK